MASDADWVDDVRRWYLAGTQPVAAASQQISGPGASSAEDDAALGYEAAHPALQARNWPDAPAASAPVVL